MPLVEPDPGDRPCCGRHGRLPGCPPGVRLPQLPEIATDVWPDGSTTLASDPVGTLCDATAGGSIACCGYLALIVQRLQALAQPATAGQPPPCADSTPQGDDQLRRARPRSSSLPVPA